MLQIYSHFHQITIMICSPKYKETCQICILAPPPPPPIFLFMQYMMLRVALHEVLIMKALGHVEANVKSFEKKSKKETKTILKITRSTGRAAHSPKK